MNISFCFRLCPLQALVLKDFPNKHRLRNLHVNFTQYRVMRGFYSDLGAIASKKWGL